MGDDVATRSSRFGAFRLIDSTKPVDDYKRMNQDGLFVTLPGNPGPVTPWTRLELIVW
jgi:hypothetical protein